MGTYKLYGLTVQYSREVENYARELREYQKYEDELLTKFDKFYKEYGSMDTMMNKIDEDCEGLISDLVSHYINMMIDKGFYDLSADVFLSKYLSCLIDSFSSVEKIDEVREKYDEIVAGKEQAAEYRRMRKANRGR